jgi:hypothetical protein
MKIDCGRCVMRGAGCSDCVVSVLNPAGATRYRSRTAEYLDEAEVRALGVLANAGLVPPLRLSLPGSQLRPGARTWALPEVKAS